MNTGFWNFGFYVNSLRLQFLVVPTVINSKVTWEPWHGVWTLESSLDTLEWGPIEWKLVFHNRSKLISHGDKILTNGIWWWQGKFQWLAQMKIRTPNCSTCHWVYGIADIVLIGKSQSHLKMFSIKHSKLLIPLNLDPWLQVFLIGCVLKQDIYI